MATNDFIGYASSGSANIMSQAAYAAAAEQSVGVQPGMASSKLANKIWRQGANMAAALGRIAAARGYNALDNGDLNALQGAIDDMISVGTFNHMFFSQTSGNYTAPRTGVYRITLKGGGGAGAFRNIDNTSTGGGGGEGAMAIFYVTLTKNTAYAYTIGAGAQSGYAVDDGQGNISYVDPTDSGSTSISINNSTFSVAGGKNAWTGGAVPHGGQGGYSFALPGVTGHRIFGCPGQNGFFVSTTSVNELGGSGGGNGGARSYSTGGDSINGQYGGGGAGMSYRNSQQPIDFYRGGNGGDGYILIEYAG